MIIKTTKQGTIKIKKKLFYYSLKCKEEIASYSTE